MGDMEDIFEADVVGIFLLKIVKAYTFLIITYFSV